MCQQALEASGAPEELVYVPPDLTQGLRDAETFTSFVVGLAMQ